MIAIITAVVAMSGAPQCATVNNTNNRATWNVGRRRYAATFEDTGEAELVYSRPVPQLVRVADEMLLLGEPGPKLVRVCKA